MACFPPDSLKTAFDPDELAGEALCTKFSEETSDIADVRDAYGICVVYENLVCRVPGTESCSCGLGRKHLNELGEAKEGTFEEGAGYAERDSSVETGGGVGCMGTDIKDKGGGVCEVWREV
jgi:hypothetical protein